MSSFPATLTVPGLSAHAVPGGSIAREDGEVVGCLAMCWKTNDFTHTSVVERVRMSESTFAKHCGGCKRSRNTRKLLSTYSGVHAYSALTTSLDTVRGYEGAHKEGVALRCKLFAGEIRAQHIDASRLVDTHRLALWDKE